jgi:hypothetical protein
MRIRKLRSFLFEQFDDCGDVFLFGLTEAVPPLTELVRILNFLFHNRNITI